MFGIQDVPFKYLKYIIISKGQFLIYYNNYNNNYYYYIFRNIYYV